MPPLIDKMYEMVNIEDCQVRRDSEDRFIELLTFSSFDDIIQLLDEVDQNYHIEIPVWARMLAYRLAYLQKPHDILLLKRMILGLWRYGPDWDDEARKLESELKNIEAI